VQVCNFEGNFVTFLYFFCIFYCLIVVMGDESTPPDELKPNIVEPIDLKSNIDQPEETVPCLSNIPQPELHVVVASVTFATNEKYKAFPQIPRTQ
jgi:hypothetical protein